MTAAPALQLLIDLGTTRLAGRLLDAQGGGLAEAGLDNPQFVHGTDVIRRLQAATEGAAAELQQLALQAVTQLAAELLRQAGQPLAAVRQGLLAANPAMIALLRGQPVAGLLRPPYRPPSLDGVWLHEAGLPPLYLLPAVSGFVGGDLLAYVYGQLPLPGPTLLIDVGTNGEMALWDGQDWWCSSVAAGPTFEGAHLDCGMRAEAGAVYDVAVEQDRLRLRVIGDGLPRGLCGSGLTAAIGAAVAAGLVGADGGLLPAAAIDSNLARYLCQDAGQPALSLYRDARCQLLIRQEEIRQFQLAKGALHAGAQCLLERAGLAPPALERVLLSGALGQALAPQTLKSVALLPEYMIKKVRFVGAGVLAGLGRLAVRPEGLAELDALRRAMRPYPLSGTPAFEQAFLAALDFASGPA